MTPADSDYPVRPKHINAKQHLWNAFDHCETEVSAGYIVRLCQERGAGWAPFTKEQIEARYQEAGHKNFGFNRLINKGWIKEDDGVYTITHEFVARCFKGSPSKGYIRKEVMEEAAQ